MGKIKTAEQVEHIRRSCRLLAELFQQLELRVKPGVTPLQLDEFAQKFIGDHGGVPAFLGFGGFPNALCTSVNEAVIHGIPDTTPLKEGDIISIDCGINLDGYFSDAAHTYPVGQISQRVQELLVATEESLYLGIEQAVAGNRIHHISRAVYERTGGKGYGVVREFCGHGVGLGVHEEPQVPNYVGRGPNPRLKVGMVLAIEPMITLGTDDVYVDEDDEWTVLTLDGSLAAHFEHTVYIGEQGPEILTGKL